MCNHGDQSEDRTQASGGPEQIRDRARAWRASIRNRPERCVVVGSGTLAVSCCEQIRASGRAVSALLPTDAALDSWGKREDVVRLDSIDALGEWLKNHEIDWLFSVANPLIMPAALLDAIHGGAFNYHDGPLPRHAGSHATSWALLAGETEHAICWHCLSFPVDGGHIAIRRAVPIEAHDTALSLNLKCYHAAREGFAELLSQLDTGELVLEQQDIAQRSFHAKWRRPEAGAHLRWSMTAYDLSTLARALDFGEHYPNPLTSPKLWIADTAFAIRQVHPLRRCSGQPPGTLIGVASDAWQVATGSTDVLVRGLSSLEGVPYVASELADTLALGRGSPLPVLTQEEAELARSTLETLAPSEAFWRERLVRSGARRPLFSSSHDHSGQRACETTDWSPPRPMMSCEDPAVVTLGTFLVCISLDIDQSCIQVGWRVDEAATLSGRMAGLAEIVPLEVQIERRNDFRRHLQSVTLALELMKQHRTHPRDIVSRYPELRTMLALQTQHPWEIGISFVRRNIDSTNRALAPRCAVGKVATLEIGEDGSFRWTYDIRQSNRDIIERLNDRMKGHGLFPGSDF
ncbi:formyltransferase family protein [Burkholderia sola]|uniref:formyltransferase family protein n=1 Tax=Burkholderia TaxID=32008 RepID=UPI001AE63D7A|nr:formyltransferase family protein [Burkholderia sp. AcTa6-5]MBP0713533.1 formyl transferase [Burkholderia sp. AcTa6-5]